MLVATVLTPSLALAPAPDAVAAVQPRTCPGCGVYRGPNLSRVYDPYRLRVDIWPEFNAATCQFEVAGYSFVTLGRGAAPPSATTAPPCRARPAHLDDAPGG